jgi:hypothetical protein
VTLQVGNRADLLSCVMPSRRAALLIAISVGLLVGIGYPIGDLGLACGTPTSEACVWAKAYFPLTLGLSLVLLGGSTVGLVYAVLTWWRRPARRL